MGKDKKKDKNEKFSLPPASKDTCQEACDKYLELMKTSVFKDVLGSSINHEYSKFEASCPTRCQKNYNELQAFCIASSTSIHDADACLRFSTRGNVEKTMDDKKMDKQIKKILKSYRKHLKEDYEKPSSTVEDE